MSSTLVVGCTGAVGHEVLKTLLSLSNSFTTVHTISRREPKTSGATLNSVVDVDTATWANKLSTLQPPPDTVISALGTTRTAAGGIANQWKIDHDLNVDLARAAKAAGVKTFVFVSSVGAGSMLSVSPYLKMKTGVENAIKGLGFDNAIILRPGAILGERENPEAGQTAANTLVRALGRISQGLKDSMGQESEVIARAAVRATELARERKAPSNPWILNGNDIIRLGRTEWQP